MTTIATTRPAASAAGRQLRTVTARHMREIVRTLAIAIGITILVIAVFQIVARVFGDLEDGALIVVGEGGEEFRIHLVSAWTAAAAGAAIVAAFVHHIVVAAQDARIEIANGTTRPNLIIASLATAVVTTVVVTALAALTYGIEGLLGLPRENSLIGTIIDEGGMSMGRALLFVAIGALGAMLFALAVGTVFIRFPWYVGVAALILIFWVVPTVAYATNWAWLQWLTTFTVWTGLLGILACGAAYALMVRRIPVP